MKKILTIAALLIGYFTYAIGPVAYYVKAGGNDAANGLSDANAWGTIAKVNGFTFATGDTIKFKQGDTFYGSIVVPASNLVFTSYGTGAQPLITGFTTLSGWTNAGGGVWNISASAVKNTVNMVTLNGVAQEVGRYPNSDAANGGYLTNDTFFTNTRYKCAALNGTNWTGAEVVARLHGYRVERNTISSQSVDTITYSRTIGEINPRYNGVSASPAIPPSKGFGMFIQRDIRTLDKLGEWFFNTSTSVMSMYFGAGTPSSYTIKASTVDTLININNQNNITINNIAFEGGNLYGIFFKDGSNRTITNCSFNNSGYKAISGWYSFNTLIDGNTVNNSMSGGIEVRAGATNITVTNNTVTNTGMLKGMSSFYDAADCNAIYTVSNSIVRHNIINTVGYCGIRFESTNNNVDSNYINNYCQVRNDGGAIYTYFTRAANSTINNNIITNGGYPIEGTQEFNGSHGLYLDGGAGGITINGNTVSGVPGVGFAASFGYFFNSPKNITATNNTFYNGNGWYYGRLQSESQFGFVFKKNIIFTTASDRVIMLHTNAGLDQTTTPVVSTIQQSLQQMGVIDSNYYNMPNTAPFSWYYAPTTGGLFTGITTANFATWNSYTSNDIHTVASNSSAYQLQYNATNSATTFNFAGLSKKDVAGTVYNNSATIPAWGSKILIDNGTTGTPPTVNPGSPDITITLPVNSVTMAGSATAGTAAIASNTWFRSYGPMTYTITNAANYNTTITGLVAGFYNFSLTVTDINGLSATGIRGVQVNPANIIPVANIAGVANITLPVSTVTLNGTGSTDADGTIVSYAWTKVSGPATYTIVSPTGSTTAVNSLVAGTYTFQLIVTDNVGAASTPATITFTVNPAVVVTGCTNCIITNQIPRN